MACAVAMSRSRLAVLATIACSGRIGAAHPVAVAGGARHAPRSDASRTARSARFHRWRAAWRARPAAPAGWNRWRPAPRPRVCGAPADRRGRPGGAGGGRRAGGLPRRVLRLGRGGPRQRDANAENQCVTRDHAQPHSWAVRCAHASCATAPRPRQGFVAGCRVTARNTEPRRNAGSESEGRRRQQRRQQRRRAVEHRLRPQAGARRLRQHGLAGPAVGCRPP